MYWRGNQTHLFQKILLTVPVIKWQLFCPSVVSSWHRNSRSSEQHIPTYTSSHLFLTMQEYLMWKYKPKKASLSESATPLWKTTHLNSRTRAQTSLFQWVQPTELAQYQPATQGGCSQHGKGPTYQLQLLNGFALLQSAGLSWKR